MKNKINESVKNLTAFLIDISDFLFYIVLILYLGLITFNEVFPRSISGFINLDFVFLIVALLFGLYVIFKVSTAVSKKREIAEGKPLQRLISYFISLATVGLFLIAMAFKVSAYGMQGYVVLTGFALLLFVVIIFMLNS